MSAIHGQGWGSGHEWAIAEQHKGLTVYKCRECGAYFAHSYDGTLSIFKAIQESGVARECGYPDNEIRRLRAALEEIASGDSPLDECPNIATIALAEGR